MSIVSQTFGVAGQVDVTPRRVQLTVTDNFAAITTAGYLTEKGISPYVVYPTDIFDITYAYNNATGTGIYGEFICTISSSGLITLSPSNPWGLDNTFLPVLSFGGNSVGIVYAEQFGVYTLSGNILFYTLEILLSSKGSSTGNALITGLPPLTYVWGSANLYVNGITCTGTQYSAAYSPSPLGIVIQGTANTGVNTLCTDANFANNSYLAINGTYQYREYLS